MRVRLTMRMMIESNDVGYCVHHSSLDHVPMCHTAHRHVRDPHGSFTYSLAALVQQMRYIKSAVQLIYKLKYETGDA